MPLKREGSAGGLTNLGKVLRELSDGSLNEIEKVHREESDGTLTLVYSLVHAPKDLTASYSAASCAMELSWDPDDENSQEIYRCTGSGCDPTTKIDTVAAGVSSYSDSVQNTATGTTINYEVRSTLGSSNHAEVTKTTDCTT